MKINLLSFSLFRLSSTLHGKDEDDRHRWEELKREILFARVTSPRCSSRVLLAVGQPAYPRGIYGSKHSALIRFPPANRAAQGERALGKKKNPARGNGRLTACLISVDGHRLRATMKPYGDDRSGLLEICGGGDVGDHLREELAPSIGNGWFCLCNWSIRLLSRIRQSSSKVLIM